MNPQEQAALSERRGGESGRVRVLLKGRFFWNKRTADGLKVALAYFDQASTRIANYAQAYSGLADTYALLGDWQYAVMTPREALPKAKAAAIKALELDNSLGEAHNSLAFCLDGFDWDFDAAGREFRRAIELNPGYATAHHWYAWHLALLHRYDEAIEEMRKAESARSAVSRDQRRPGGAAGPGALVRRIDPAEPEDDRDGTEFRPRAQSPRPGVPPEAHDRPGHRGAPERPSRSPAAARRAWPTSLARTSHPAREAKPKRCSSELKKRSSPGHSYASEIAVIYTALGDSNQAMAWLEKGYDERFNPGVLIRPGFDPLRSDPRFRDLERRVGFPR